MNTLNTNPEEYDLVVLGSRAGGKVMAWTSAQKGQRVVVVERKYVGGSCPNIACLPSKNIIHSAKVASFFYRGQEFGISKENARIDMRAVRERKCEMVRNLVDIHLDQYKKSGAELVMGTGRFVGPRTVEVELAAGGTRTFRGKNVVINTGTRATLEPIPGLAEAKPLTHIEALNLDHIPEHLLVLGAGYVGLELAQAFRRFGAEVTLIDRNGRLAHHEDDNASATEMPPRNPPQIMMVTAPVGNLCQMLIISTGVPTLTHRAKSIAGIANQHVSYVDAHVATAGLVRVPRKRTENFVATIFGERLCAS
jgi:pyruvate/2-oxoglutarate dehydrogenase complex dihydrolipoamide dehydrogenase (E3) component